MMAGTPDMTYEARTPIAVFLGPSLDLATARSILPANYYPPVRMGDIYRLLATGVRLIVIIDGVFHAAVPVWQREILAALKAGITVVGASSMGALRAAELAPYGMIGCGTVFQWYVQGRIAGDDEVALLHAPATQGYRGVSEALVNMRDTLEQACQAGILASEACADLLDWLKGLCYGHRTYDALFASPPFARLPQPTQQALRTFLLAHRRISSARTRWTRSSCVPHTVRRSARWLTPPCVQSLAWSGRSRSCSAAHSRPLGNLSPCPTCSGWRQKIGRPFRTLWREPVGVSSCCSGCSTAACGSRPAFVMPSTPGGASAMSSGSCPPGWPPMG